MGQTARRVLSEQWPILLVGVVFVAAFALVTADRWRRGALVIGIGVALAAALRLTLSEERAGLLVVRGKPLDFSMMASVAAAMVYMAWTIDPLGTS
jgi:hypothetical protein